MTPGAFLVSGYATHLSSIESTNLVITFTIEEPAPEISGVEEFDESTTVTITYAAEGTQIFYTLDGSDSTNSSTAIEYSAPFELTQTTTIAAVAINQSTSEVSGIASKTFFSHQPQSAVTIVFAANDKTKEMTVDSLPHTFSCNYFEANGELDLIIQELYGPLPYSGYCTTSSIPAASENYAVKAGRSGNNHYITVNSNFVGSATVSGRYMQYTDAVHHHDAPIDYNITISIKAGGETAVENIQGEKVQGSKFFRDGQLLIEKNGKIYNALGAEVK